MDLHRSQMITLARGRFGSPASLVMEHVRGRGLMVRDEVADAAGLSAATVTRTVTALTGAGLLRERPDHTRAGAVGRPSVPVEIDPEQYVVVGVHLGRRVVTVALGDLAGTVRAHRTLPRRPEDPVDLEEIGVVGADLLAGLDGARPLAAGLVAPWRDLGLGPDATARDLHEVLGLEVATADHIAAVAATEFLHRRSGTSGVTLYVYARNTVGYAIAVDKGFQTEVSRVGSLTHYPTGSRADCSCGRTGCLEATASDHAVLSRARAEGLLDGAGQGQPGIEALLAAAATGDPRAHALLSERARTLGRVAAVVRDMVVPHRVILVGQAFTRYSPVLAEAIASFEESTALGPTELEFTRFGAGIQAVSACTVALGPVYDDPLGLTPRRTSRRDPAEPGADPACTTGRRSA